MTTFLLFFGISLLDALWSGNWPRAVFWLVVGIIFYALERGRHSRDDQAQTPASRREK